jgi:penicillin-binding protein 1A
LTTGVWMGRDNAQPIPGLQGGRAPAQAFAQFMKAAVARRPIENFQTQVTLPEWQLEPDEEAYFGNADEGRFVDDNGLPIESEGSAPRAEPDRQVPDRPMSDAPAPEQLDQRWVDGVLKRGDEAARRAEEPPREVQPSRPNQ